MRRMLETLKAAAVETRLAVAVASGAGNETLGFQLITDTLDVAQAISGTVTIMTRGRELAGTDNIGARVRCIRVVSADGATVRGTLLALGNHSVTTELGTTLAGYQAASGTALSSVSALPGDRLVVELGYGMTTTGTTPQYDMAVGGDGIDHANAATTTTGTVPWVEFSQDLTFGVPLPSSLDRLTRTEVPARCTAVGLTSDASAFSSLTIIDRDARVASAAADLRALEDRIVAAWNPTWDRWWNARGSRAQLVTDAEIAEVVVGGAAQRLLFKTSLRVCEYLMCRAGG
jgi:hypothetical protein